MQYEESSREKSGTKKKLDMNATRKRARRVKHKENMKTESNSDTLKECNTKKVQNEKCSARTKHEN